MTRYSHGLRWSQLRREGKQPQRQLRPPLHLVTIRNPELPDEEPMPVPERWLIRAYSFVMGVTIGVAVLVVVLR